MLMKNKMDSARQGISHNFKDFRGMLDLGKTNPALDS